MDRPRTAAAERCQRWRIRQILAIQAVIVEVDQAMVEKLLAKRLITIGELGNRTALGEAIANLIRLT